MPEFAVILPAGGGSTRFGGGRDKLLEPLAGLPVIGHSLRAFLGRADVAAVVIPTRAGDAGEPPGAALRAVPALQPLLADPRVRFCAGGATRAHSVWNGVRAAPAGVEWVAVHDAARPLVTREVIDRLLAAAVAHGAAVPALPVGLTIKQADGPLPARVQRTIPRASLWAMQTPQVMRRADLLRAFETCPMRLENVTDDVQLIELAGGEVWLVDGDERNLKVTTPLDLRVAEMLAGKNPIASSQ
jgi:2-C-methyl-D-erythritol 4-phosphate cytidylyltransferase